MLLQSLTNLLSSKLKLFKADTTPFTHIVVVSPFSTSDILQLSPGIPTFLVYSLGFTAIFRVFFVVVERGNVAAVRRCIDFGATLNMMETSFVETALHFCPKSGQLATAQLLINNGALGTPSPCLTSCPIGGFGLLILDINWCTRCNASC